MRSCAPLALLLALSACSDQSITGVRLTVRYGEPPARLRVVGSTLDGRILGPSLLPRSPRPLAPESESAIVQLPDGMHGELVTFDVVGLDANRAPRMRGSAQTEVVRGWLQSVFVTLTPGTGCPEGTKLSELGDCVAIPRAPIPRASIGGGPGDGPSCFDSDDCSPDAGEGEVPATEAGTSVAEDETPAPDAGEGETAATDAGSSCGDAGCKPDMPEPEPEPPAPFCGDQVCGAGEDTCSCALDCGVPSCKECRDGSCCAAACQKKGCDLKCEGCRCAFDCTNTEESCKVTCSAGSDCHVTCDEQEPCRDIKCENGARCVLECTSSDCSFHACSGGSGAARCDDGSHVCNRACPDGSEGEPIDG
jgi:hypothetical protein